MACFGHVFGCSPDPPALDMVFVVLGEVFSQLCQENPRTCRGQSRESKNVPGTKPRKKIRTNAFRKTQITKLSSSKLPSLSQLSLLQKVGRRYSPQGGFNPPPTGVGVLNSQAKRPGFGQPSFRTLPKPKFLESERLSSPS